MTMALDRYRPFCPLRADVRVVRRQESLALADGSLWRRVTTMRLYGADASIRPYADDGEALPLPLNMRRAVRVPQGAGKPEPKPAPRAANRFERSWGGHDSIHDYRVESLRNSALKRGAHTAADFLGDD